MGQGTFHLDNRDRVKHPARCSVSKISPSRKNSTRGMRSSLLSTGDRSASCIPANRRYGAQRVAVDSQGTRTRARTLVLGASGDCPRRSRASRSSGLCRKNGPGLDELGEQERIALVNLVRWFPRLGGATYRITSPAQPDYNCIAWAAGDDSRWWEPDSFGQYYWPEDVPRQYTVEVYAEVFQRLGFEVCQDATFEVGVEKVAIFGLDGSPTHAARQLEDGTWTSKLGQLEDIEHQDLDDVSEGNYGRPVLFLKRHEPGG